MIALKKANWWLVSAIVITSCLLQLYYLDIKTASAATYYVSSSGSDSNSGFSSAPFKTIQKAANIVNPGDTVIVKDGTYSDTNSDNMVMTLTRSGTSANWITFKSENKWGAKIDGQSNATDYGFDINASYIRIEGFEFYGTWRAAIWINDFSTPDHDIYIYNNSIHDIGRMCNGGIEENGGSGIYAGEPASYVTVDSNIIHDIGRYDHVYCGETYSSNYYAHDHGVYSRSDNLTVMNNVMWNCNAGFKIASCGTNPTIVNNTFYGYSPNRQDPTVGGHILFTENYDYEPLGTVTVENNISYDPDYYMIFFYYTHAGSVQYIKNNLVYGTGYKGKNNAVLYGSYPYTPSNPVISNSMVGSTSGYDPKFINLTVNDYHLQATSPAIDKGAYIKRVIYDADGNTRAGNPDIGAYEYTVN